MDSKLYTLSNKPLEILWTYETSCMVYNQHFCICADICFIMKRAYTFRNQIYRILLKSGQCRRPVAQCISVT